MFPYSKVLREYPIDCAAMTSLRSKLDVAERPTSINRVQFSGIVFVLLNRCTKVFLYNFDGNVLGLFVWADMYPVFFIYLT